MSPPRRRGGRHRRGWRGKMTRGRRCPASLQVSATAHEEGGDSMDGRDAAGNEESGAGRPAAPAAASPGFPQDLLLRSSPRH
jgi:hypothetical protein